MTIEEKAKLGNEALIALMDIYYQLCQWEYDYSLEADQRFTRKVDILLNTFRQDHPILEDRMRKIEDVAQAKVNADREKRGGVV
jgi:hypothetical protein